MFADAFAFGLKRNAEWGITWTFWSPQARGFILGLAYPAMDRAILALSSLVVILLLLEGFSLWQLSGQASLEEKVQSLEQTRENLSQALASSQSEHDSLSSEYSKLEKRHASLWQNYSQLKAAYTGLQNVQSGQRLSSDIPSTPALDGMGFLLTPAALIVSYPNISLDLGLTTSNSMHPSIPVGQTVISTSFFDPENLPVGAIAVYRSSFSNVPIAHRIISVEGEGADRCYIFQGDNNAVPDSACVRPEQIQSVALGVLFNSETALYQACPAGAGAATPSGLGCLNPTLPAGVYPVDQPIQNLSVAFALCSRTTPSRPYTIVAPDGKIYCSSSSG